MSTRQSDGFELLIS